MRRAIAPTAALLLGCAAPSPAQLAGWGGGTGLGYEAYRFVDPEVVGIRTLSLAFVPLSVRAPLPLGGILEASGGFARADMERADGSTVHLAGPVDTELRVAFPVLPGDRLALAGILVLPTGASAHTHDEAEVAGAVATDLLPFRVSRWGSGGGMGASATAAHSAGGFGLGASVGYVVAREFEPLADEPFAYRPGDQLRVRAAVDRSVGTAGKASLVLSFQRFGEDEYGGAGLYRSGSRSQVVGSYAFRAGGETAAIAYAGVMRRSEGSFPGNPLEPAPSQDFLLLGGGVRVPIAGGVLVPSTDVRLQRTGGISARSWLVGAGVAAELPAGALVLLPSVRARLGDLAVSDEAGSGITGAELGLSLRYGAGRTR